MLVKVYSFKFLIMLYCFNRVIKRHVF